MDNKTLFEVTEDDIYEQENKFLAHQLLETAIENNDPSFAYYVATKVKASDKIALGKIVIASNDPKLNYYYARDVEGADVISHGLVVMASENLRLNYFFAKNVKGADIEAHRKVIIDSGNERYIKRFEEIDVPLFDGASKKR